ncbi:uncharacterized protein [Ptychodera flava]|uniref:uncharacterized protein n=1 Tax=Ptychodera flava TaxID=63121 RepID=UPI003969C889
MAFWKRRSQAFEPNPPETKYNVQYLGKMPANGKMGLECTMKPVEVMYRTFKFNKGKNYQRLSIEITNKGISTSAIGPVEDESTRERFVPIYKMSFGAADPVHTRIFSFVMKNDEVEGDNPWECHAFMCETSAVAKALTLYLVKAFQKATEAWENKHVKMGVGTKPKTLHITHEKGKMEHQTAEKHYQPPVSTVKITFNIDNVEEFDRVGESPKKDGGQNMNAVENNHAFATALAKRDVPSDEENEDEKENGASGENNVVSNKGEDEAKEQPKGEQVVAAFNPQLLHQGQTPVVASSPSAAKLRKERSLEKNKSDPSSDGKASKNGHSQESRDRKENMAENGENDAEAESEFSRSKKKSVRFSESDSTIPDPTTWDGETGDDDVIENTGNSKKSKSSKGILNGIANFKFGKSKK